MRNIVDQAYDIECALIEAIDNEFLFDSRYELDDLCDRLLNVQYTNTFAAGRADAE